MEAHLTSGSDTLIAGLNFKPPSATAQYCLTNRQIRYFAESGNKFDPVSSRVIRFRIAGDQGFLEASSVRLQFTLTNLKSDATLTPISQCLSLFRRARLFCSSQLVEDITELSTQATITNRLQPINRKMNDSILGHPLTDTLSDAYVAIGQSASRRLITPLPFGVLSQEKWLPCRLISGGIVLELELNDADTTFAESACDWQLTDVSLLANLHEIDSSLANSYSAHVLRGSPLHLHFTSVVCSRHLLPGPTFSVNLVRGFTRLRQIYWVFIKNGEKDSAQFKGPNNTAYTLNNDSYSWQVTIGARKWPERACTGSAETFLRLQQAAACFYGYSDMAFSPGNLQGNNFINGLDLEKVGHTEASHSGISTRDGSVVQLAIQNAPTSNNDTMKVFMVYDGLMSIRDGFVEVFD